VVEQGSHEDPLDIVLEGDQAQALVALMQRSEETDNPEKAARHERAALVSQYLIENGHLPR
jgi:hypothetical protein